MNHDETRKTVSKAYAEAVQKTGPSCCCASGAQRLGYSADDLSELPEGVADSSFGCGNPLAFAEVKKGQTVVDLGSGAGLDLLVAARAVGGDGRVIGVDMTDEMIARARANISKAGAANIEVRKGLIEKMPLANGEADWVISNCVINLSPEKAKVFAEIARVLKPGGRMHVSDIVAEEMPEELRSRTDLLTACIAGAIPEAEYLQGLRDAGLVDVEVTERLIYDEQKIRSFLNSDELPVSQDAREVTRKEADKIARSLAGKIASVKVRARKPV